MLEGSKLTARDVMTRDVVTVFPYSSILYLAKLLARHRISGVPVIDDERHVVGMISENDLLRWSDEPGEKQAWWLNMLSDGFDLAPDFLQLIQSEREKVRGVMNTDVTAVAESTPLAEIAKLIIEKGVKRVPVVTDGKLVGVVSRADLVRALAQS